MGKYNFSLITLIVVLMFNGCGDTNHSEGKAEAPVESAATESETESVAEEEPVETEQAVDIQISEITNNMFSIPITSQNVDVTAIVDSVEVQEVIGNRGNCKMTSVHQANFPRSLQYGESVTAGFIAGCRLIQVDVVTDKGTFSFTKTSE